MTNRQSVALRYAWQKSIAGYIRLCFKRPLLLLAFFLVIAIISSLFAHDRLKVVTRLEALLPEDTQSVLSLKQSRQRVGSTDFFVIAIRSESKNIHAIAKMQDLLADSIKRNWTDTRWVQIERSTQFFKDHALYYLPKEKLLSLEEILSKELLRQSAKSIPGLIDLSDDNKHQSISAQLETWLTPRDLKALGMPPQIESEFLDTFEKASSRQANNQTPQNQKPALYRDRLIGPDSDVGVVLVQLKKPSTDLDYARFALNRGSALIEQINPTSISPDLHAQVVGAYRSFKEVDTVSNDALIATCISVVSVLTLLTFIFGSLRSIGIIFFPLILAGCYTMGITALVYGRLTVLTVFVLAMLAGMGIDYGIHFLGRIEEELKRTASSREACRISMNETGTALLTAAATTIASFLILEFGHFEGFKEFGIVASYGLLLCVLTTILVIPPLVAIRVHLEDKPSSRSSLLSFQTEDFLDRHKTQLNRLAFVVAVCITVFCIPLLSNVNFEHNFRNLRGPKTGATIGYGRAIGKNASTTPSIILGQSVSQMEDVHQYLLTRLDDNHIHSFITLRTFVPNEEHQRARSLVIKRINNLVTKKALSRVEGTDGELIATLKRLSESTPFTNKSLPKWASRLITEQDGSIGKIGHLYAKVKDWDARSVISFKSKYEMISKGHSDVPVANSAFILSDIVRLVKSDGLLLLILASVTLLLLLFFYTRSLRDAALLFVSVASGAVWTAGFMSLFNLKIGLYNMITIPIILGVGIDSAIHIYHRARMNHISSNAAITTGLLVTAASWTTVCGFTGLLFVSHKGLQTIGVMACIGVALSWFATITILPFLLSHKRHEKAGLSMEQRFESKV